MCVAPSGMILNVVFGHLQRIVGCVTVALLASAGPVSAQEPATGNESAPSQNVGTSRAARSCWICDGGFGVIGAGIGALVRTERWVVVDAAALTQAALREAVRLEAARHEFEARLNSQAQRGQTRSWAARHPVLTGALIGAGAGTLLFGIAICQGTDGGDVPCAAYAPVGAVFGAPVGAAIGFVISR